MKSTFFKTVAAAGLFAGALLGSAALKNEKGDISTVIVTGHYIHAQELVKLIQAETHQPVIFISELDPKQAYFVPAKEDAPKIRIEAKEYENFINFAHPAQVVVLGNTRYTPAFYAENVNKEIKTYRLNDNDWYFIAAQCEELFGIKGLAAKYRETLTALGQGGAIENTKNGVRASEEPQVQLP